MEVLLKLDYTKKRSQTNLTASKKLFSDVKRTIHGVIVGFRVFTITGTLREKESREHN